MTDFAQRLAETIAWCLPRAGDPRTSLRSVTCAPSLLLPTRHDVVARVVQVRAQQLHGRTLPTGLSGGRLLVYFPDSDLSDGAAESESGGFFDVYNTPPWDTWIALFDDGDAADVSTRHYLVAWCPAMLVPLASAGMAVNPEQCIEWLDRSGVGARLEIERVLRS